MMHSSNKVALIVLGCALWCSRVGFATPVLDQSFAGSNYTLLDSFSSSTSYDAQTFTVGRAGYFSGVDVNVARAPATTGALIAELRTTVGGVPSTGISGTN